MEGQGMPPALRSQVREPSRLRVTMGVKCYSGTKTTWILTVPTDVITVGERKTRNRTAAMAQIVTWSWKSRVNFPIDTFSPNRHYTSASAPQQLAGSRCSSGRPCLSWSKATYNSAKCEGWKGFCFSDQSPELHESFVTAKSWDLGRGA